MKKFLIFPLTFFLLTKIFFCQQDTSSKLTWLKQNTIEISSLSPDSVDFSDLQPLKNVIGNSKIVMLGEESHGDGTTFEAKSRLIKFLHEEMNFEVLAFECGIFDCWAVNAENVDALRMAIYPIWSYSEETQQLQKYIAKETNSSHSLKLAGVDCQNGGFGSSVLKRTIKTYAAKYQLLPDSIPMKNFETVLLNFSSWEVGSKK